MTLRVFSYKKEVSLIKRSK